MKGEMIIGLKIKEINNELVIVNEELTDRELTSNYYINEYFRLCDKIILMSLNFNKLSSVLYDKVFVAYKLFYVGCSRARKKLYVMVKKQMITNFEKEFISKMKSIGFEVIE